MLQLQAVKLDYGYLRQMTDGRKRYQHSMTEYTKYLIALSIFYQYRLQLHILWVGGGSS